MGLQTLSQANLWASSWTSKLNSGPAHTILDLGFLDHGPGQSSLGRARPWVASFFMTLISTYPRMGGKRILVGVFSDNWELVYLMNCTKSDIAYSVSRLNRYTINPRSDRWTTIVRLLCYLRYTHDLGLHYTKYTTVIEDYCDANWILDMKKLKIHEWICLYAWLYSSVL